MYLTAAWAEHSDSTIKATGWQGSHIMLIYSDSLVAGFVVYVWLTGIALGDQGDLRELNLGALIRSVINISKTREQWPSN